MMIKGRNGIEKQYTSEHSEHGSEGTDSSAYLGGPETVFQWWNLNPQRSLDRKTEVPFLLKANPLCL